MSKAVTGAMKELAMTGGSFEVALKPLPEGSAAGNEEVEFLVAANAARSRVAGEGRLRRRVVTH